MSHKTILAIASAVLLSASGAAIAAEHANTPMGERQGQTSVNGQVTPRVNAEHPVEPSMGTTTYLKGIRNGHLIGPGGDRALLGKPVLNGAGRQIGEVSRITPEGVVISMGQKMGIGAHEVMIDPAELTVTREKGGLAVISSLDEGQINRLPEYNPGATPGMK